MEAFLLDQKQHPHLNSLSLWVTLYNQPAPVFQAMCCDPREQTPWDLSRGLTVRHQAPLDALQPQQVRLLRIAVLWCAVCFSKGQELSLSLFSDPSVRLWLKGLASGPLRSHIKGTHVRDSCWSLLPGKSGPCRRGDLTLVTEGTAGPCTQGPMLLPAAGERPGQKSLL